VDAKPNLIQAFAISALPTIDIGLVIVAEASEIWVWVETAHYTGYRSPLCGRPVDGHTVTPLASEIDAVGGLVSKSAYAGLWAYAQENNLVVSQMQWANNIGAHWFIDVSSSQFRVPDLRNQFRRYTGTDADSANERALGSRQLDAFQSHGHKLQVRYGGLSGMGLSSASPGREAAGSGAGTGTPQTHGVNDWAGEIMNVLGTAYTMPRTATETRSANVAFPPRIHV